MRAKQAWLLGIGAALAAPLAGSALDDRIHVVKPGESLWRIAAAVTGDSRDWPALYRANRDQIKDPALVYPGQRLTIPDSETAPSAGLEPDSKQRD